MPLLLAPLLNLLTSKWLWIGIAVAAAIGGVAWLRHDAASARQEAAEATARAVTAEQINAENAAELARVLHAEETARASIARVKAIADQRAADLAAIRKRVNATRDDSSCGPAVVAALDGLRARKTNRQNTNGITGSPGGTHDVQ